MSQEKAQLIAPQGHFTVPGLNVAGVVTASSFSGNCTGTASSIAQGTNVVVGVMTASSFAGDVFGNAAGLSTTTAGLKLGIVTATSFAGNFTGIGSGLTGTPNIVAGLVTATQFVGNTPGLAAGISAGKNLAAGIITATTFYGDGSNLTGAGSTAFIRQTVGSGTTINLNDGNIVNLLHVNEATVSFANTSTADDVTIIRPLDLASEAFTSGAVTFDGTGDYLSLAASTDLQLDGDFTVEFWVYPQYSNTSIRQTILCNNGNWTSETSTGIQVNHSSYVGKAALWNFDDDPNNAIVASSSQVGVGQWTHVAFVRSSNTITVYLNGVADGTATNSSTMNFGTGATWIGQVNISSENFEGILSNLRVVKGTAVYTHQFTPSLAALTNVTNTKLLCCQDTSSTTVGAVKPGTITANGDPSAGSQSIIQPLSTSLTWPTSITWNGGSAPTLASANSYSLSGQVFNLVTSDGGVTWYGYEEVNNTILSSNLTLWAWGHNNQGKLGQNTTVSHSSPIQIPGDWSRITQAQGDLYNAVKPDGTLWIWGNNSYGGLGLNQAGPVKISSPTQIGSGTDWARPGGAGDNARSAVKTDGTLWMWGNNQRGTLGQNSQTSYSSPVQVPGTTWSTAAHHLGGTDLAMAAIKTDGTLWTWGYGVYGQLGLNSQTQYSSPKQIPGTWTSVGGHNYMMAATKSDGTLWTWGENTPGVLGDNSRTQRSSPTQIPGTTWAAVSPFGGYSIMSALKTDGTLWAWGNNGYGSLGQNNRTSYSSPVQVGSDTTWKQPAAGGTDGITGAVKTDGTLWTWGYNYAGALGQNLGHGTGTFSSPVQVPGTAWQEVIVSKDTTFALQSS